jgi:hypothetical protein
MDVQCYPVCIADYNILYRYRIYRHPFAGFYSVT